MTCRLEVALLLIVYIAYGYTDGGAVSYLLLTLSSWFLVISWLFAPYIFNPSGFEWQKYVLKIFGLLVEYLDFLCFSFRLTFDCIYHIYQTAIHLLWACFTLLINQDSGRF